MQQSLPSTRHCKSVASRGTHPCPEDHAPSGWADGAEEEKGGISRGSGGGSQGYSPGVRGGISKGANGAITVRLDAGSRGSCLSPPPLLQSAITFAAVCRSWRDALAHTALGMNRVPC